MTVLMLRGPQTPGELRARSERIHRFESGDELDRTLEGLVGASWSARAAAPPGRARAALRAAAGGRRGRGRGAPGAGRAGGRRAATPAPRAAGRARPRGLEPRVERLEREVAALRRAAAGPARRARRLASEIRPSQRRPLTRGHGEPEMGHMHPPVTQREAQLAPVIPPVEPSAQFAARVGSGIFAGEALILFVLALLPEGSELGAGRWVIPAAARCAPSCCTWEPTGWARSRSRWRRPAARCWCPPTCCCPPRARRWPARRSTAGWRSTPPTSSPPARRPSSSR